MYSCHKHRLKVVETEVTKQKGVQWRASKMEGCKENFPQPSPLQARPSHLPYLSAYARCLRSMIYCSLPLPKRALQKKGPDSGVHNERTRRQRKSSKKRNSFWTYKFFTLSMYSTDTDCWRTLWTLHPWRFSELAWAVPRGTDLALKLALFLEGGWTKWPSDIPSNFFIILWICGSKNTSYQWGTISNFNSQIYSWRVLH